MSSWTSLPVSARPTLPPDHRSDTLPATPAPAAPAPTVLLLGHGARDPEGADEYRALAADVAARLGDGGAVTPCFLELAEPSILDALQAAYDAGVRDALAVPCFLFGAGHVKNGLPTAIQAARMGRPDLKIRYGAARRRHFCLMFRLIGGNCPAG